MRNNLILSINDGVSKGQSLASYRRIRFVSFFCSAVRCGCCVGWKPRLMLEQ